MVLGGWAVEVVEFCVLLPWGWLWLRVVLGMGLAVSSTPVSLWLQAILLFGWPKFGTELGICDALH